MQGEPCLITTTKWTLLTTASTFHHSVCALTCSHMCRITFSGLDDAATIILCYYQWETGMYRALHRVKKALAAAASKR